jgi:hypothetical protein
MRIIRASEISEYIYCHRAWWLRHVQGLKSANVTELAGGTATHAGHGRLVGLASTLRALAILLFVAAALVIFVSLITPH